MSTDDQSTSPERQLRLANEFSERKFRLPIHHIFSDEGISAHKNVIRPEFDKMLAYQYDDGDVIITESSDRLTRKGDEDYSDIVRHFRGLGVKVFTIDDGMEITDKNMNTKVVNLVKGIMAEEYSAKLSSRVTQGKKMKLESAIKNGTVFSKMTPHWIEVKNDKYCVLEDRAELINWIFNQALINGSRVIARLLNERGVKAWTNYLRQNNNVSEDEKRKIMASWTADYIKQLLKNRAVLGEVNSKIYGASKLYPQIISNDLFEKVSLASSKRAIKGGGNTGKNFSNLVTRIAKCASCKSSITYINKGTKYAYLECSRKCSRSKIPYKIFENNFLKYCSLIPWGKSNDSESALKLLNAEVNACELNLNKANVKRSNLMNLIMETGDIELMGMRDKLDIEIHELNTTLKRIKSEIITETHKAKGITDQNIKELSEEIQSGDFEARAKLNSALSERLDLLLINLERKGTPPHYIVYVGDYREVMFMGTDKVYEFDHNDSEN
jgi:DNA invertase Pin-like site-specific DNA recombinase